MRAKRWVLVNDAEKWLEAAETLLQSRKGAGLAKWAIYCAGYAIEFLLKALICRSLGVDELPINYETHDLHRLAQSAGVFDDLLREQRVNWQFITNTWSTALRYTGKRFSKRDAEIFIARVREVTRWLKERLQP